MQVLITVFTPTYNRCDKLKMLFQSLQNQTKKVFEWVIVDDGSTDGTREYCESLCKMSSFSIVYHYKENEGKHAAINFGSKLANGEYFFIVDSDDYLLPDAIETISDYCLQIKDEHNMAGVVGLRGKKDGSAWLEWNGGKKTTKRGCDALKKEYLDATSFEYRYKLGIKGDRAEVLKTEILRSHLFPVFPGERFMNEGLLWASLANEGFLFRWFNKVVYITEYHEDGLTKNIRKHYKESWKSTCYYSNSMLIYKDIPLKERARYCVNYYRYGISGGEKVTVLYKNCNDKLLSFVSIFIAKIKKVK